MKLNKKTLRLRSCMDGEVYRFEDDGFSPNTGEPSATRQQITQLAASRVVITLEGKEVDLCAWAWDKQVPAWNDLTHVDGPEGEAVSKQYNKPLCNLFPVWGPQHEAVKAAKDKQRAALRNRFVRPLMEAVNKANKDETGASQSQLNAMTAGLKGRGLPPPPKNE